MHDFDSYKKLLSAMIEINYQILKTQTNSDLLKKRDTALRLYTKFEQGTDKSKFDIDQLIQIDLLMQQLSETNKYVIEMLERKVVVMRIQQKIRRERKEYPTRFT